MKLQTISNKVIITDNVTGEEKLQMTQPVFKLNGTVKIIANHTVLEDEEMRPDLISVQHYGNDSYVDIILKFNGISNPFSIKSGIVLVIPDKDGIEIFKKNFKKISTKPRTQFTDTSRMNKQDANRKQFLEKMSASKKNGSKENLPPNMLKSDQPSKLVTDNSIILGSNIPNNNRNRE